MADVEDLLFEVTVGEPWSQNTKSLLKSKLGLRKEKEGTRFEQLTSAKVLIFTGHHWVRYGEPPGSFHKMDENHHAIKSTGIDLSKVMREKIDGKLQKATSDNARLIIMSGCHSLIPESAKYFHTTFPKAVALGWAGKAPMRKGKFYERFLESIPGVLDVDETQHVETIVLLWKAHIANCAISESFWEGGSIDPTRSLAKPGYMSADGTVHLWSSDSKSWS